MRLLILITVILLSVVSAEIHLDTKLGDLNFGGEKAPMVDVKLAILLDSRTKSFYAADAKYTKCFAAATGARTDEKNTQCETTYIARNKAAGLMA